MSCNIYKHCTGHVHQNLVLGYIGAKLNDIQIKDQWRLANILMSASIRDIKPTFFCHNGAFLIHDLVTIASKYIYEEIHKLFFNDYSLNFSIMDKLKFNQHESQITKSLFIYCLESILDYTYFNDITPMELYDALTYSGTLTPDSCYVEQQDTEDEYLLKIHQLIERVANIYINKYLENRNSE